MLLAGHTTCRCRGSSHCSSFSGPQSGWCRRAASRSAATGSAIVRTGVGRATPVPKGRTPARVVARPPFAAGLAADGVAGAELGHVVEPQPVLIDEAFALSPRVPSPARASPHLQVSPSVKVLPMYPVCTIALSNSGCTPCCQASPSLTLHSPRG